LLELLEWLAALVTASTAASEASTAASTEVSAAAAATATASAVAALVLIGVIVELPLLLQTTFQFVLILVGVGEEPVVGYFFAVVVEANPVLWLTDEAADDGPDPVHVERRVDFVCHGIEVQAMENDSKLDWSGLVWDLAGVGIGVLVAPVVAVALSAVALSAVGVHLVIVHVVQVFSGSICRPAHVFFAELL